MHSAKTSQTSDKYIVRMPDGMRDVIAMLAKGNGRSMNAEIVTRLEASILGDEAYATKAQGKEIIRLLHLLVKEDGA